ncbi:hypothetical protein [Kutzneria sp. CA-103260]|uniref:hypothetical protein n=1 Tax=Kutzneria sp. CA-103260 TaxID=2802641 RepID=UPI001BA46890|nr:hypothetical protein [Kutzneria sp. CA-103260]QUQ69919.1 hypothetical protein JJ691_76870 [Kutzneria sp. CA-103260]
MTWQEELRALDAELADKGITPAEYRRRRDNLLAAASGGFPPAAQVAPQRPAQPTPPQGQPAQGQPPQPIQDLAPQQPDQVQYQPIQPMPTQADPAQYQTVQYQPAQLQPGPPPTPAQGQPAQAGPPFTGQPFTGAPIQPMPSAQQPMPPNNHVVPPWSPVTELPMYQPGTDQQAPAPQYAPRTPLEEDLFNTRAAKRKSRAALLVVVVVVALLLLAGGWWFGVRPTMEAASTSQAPQALHLEDLPAMPGTARLDRAELSVFEGQNRGLFDAREADFLQADKVSRVTFTGSTDGKLNYVVFAFVTDSAASAKKTSADLLEYQDLGGLHQADGTGLPDAVKVVKLVAGDQVQYRAIYASGLNAVMVAVAQAQPADESGVAKALRDTATTLLDKVPAS